MDRFSVQCKRSTEAWITNNFDPKHFYQLQCKRSTEAWITNNFDPKHFYQLNDLQSVSIVPLLDFELLRNV